MDEVKNKMLTYFLLKGKKGDTTDDFEKGAFNLYNSYRLKFCIKSVDCN